MAQTRAKPRMLVTNDDGIFAEGLWLLAQELSELGEVVIVAPDREQSGVGTAVTFARPVRANKVIPLVPGFEAYAVEGTPGDAVILALRSLLSEPVDLVFSGINLGANLGNDALISGTVGAALQAHCAGIPSVAVSVGALRETILEPAAALARLLAHELLQRDLPKDILLNVNLPNLPIQKIQGLDITRLGRRSYVDLIEEGRDGKGRSYYWIARGKPASEVEPGTDVWSVRNGRISITPLRSDLTTDPRLRPLEGLDRLLFESLQQAFAPRRRRARRTEGNESRGEPH